MTLENFVPNSADTDRPSGPCSVGGLHAHLFLDLSDPQGTGQGSLLLRCSMDTEAALPPRLKEVASLAVNGNPVPVQAIKLQGGSEALRGRIPVALGRALVPPQEGATGNEPVTLAATLPVPNGPAEDMPLPPPAEAPPAGGKPLPEPAAAEAPPAEEAPLPPQRGAGRRTGITQAARALAEKREQLQGARMALGNAQLRSVKLQQDAEIAQAELERVRGKLAEAEQLAKSLPETLETRQAAYDIAERELKLALGV